jgi:hypothetical protein
MYSHPVSTDSLAAATERPADQATEPGELAEPIATEVRSR